MSSVSFVRPSDLAPGSRVVLMMTRQPDMEQGAAVIAELQRAVETRGLFVVEAVKRLNPRGATLVRFAHGAACYFDDAIIMAVERTSSAPARPSASESARLPVSAHGTDAGSAGGARGPFPRVACGDAGTGA